MEVTKIHRLAFRFSKDFSIQVLAYGFLSQSSGFLFANHKHFRKVLDFWFTDFITIFTIRRLSSSAAVLTSLVLRRSCTELIIVIKILHLSHNPQAKLR